MNKMIIGLFIFYMAYLFYESYKNERNRRTFKHIIHVNGTRGKSSTSRLIEAALRDGSQKIFCKTTGTSPRIIDVDGEESLIHRRSSPNIREQVKILDQAARQGADIVVIECMAVDPYLQYISQNKILDADISIVTNVRRDHLEEMGPRLKDVAISLGNVMPKNGYFISGEEKFKDYYRQLGEKMGSEVIFAEELHDNYGIDFKENVSLALEVCKLLGIDREGAIERMKDYRQDPGVLQTYHLTNQRGRDISFVNGFAINDPDSIMIVFDLLKDQGVFKDKELIVLINNRGDRGYRAKQHAEVIEEIGPKKVWITGGYRKFMQRNISKGQLGEEDIRIIRDPSLREIDSLDVDSVIFAIGNMVGHGERIIETIERIGEKDV